MSSDVTKRALSAGLGVGALALLAPRASADTPFSSFAFPATGAPTARTMPDRLAETKSVKDFGARGGGLTDDTAAIQAAFDDAGTVVFPPGQYRITAPITFNSNERHPRRSVRVIGNGSFVFGTFPGFIFDHNDGIGDRGGHLIEGIGIRNDHPEGGCIRIEGSIMTTIRNCFLTACKYGIDIESDVNYDTMIQDCQIQGYPTGGLHGAQANGSFGVVGKSHHLNIINCDFTAWTEGIRAAMSANVFGCRFEMNGTAIVLGKNQAGRTHLAGGSVMGCGLEANDIGIHVHHGNLLHLASISIEGSTFAIRPDRSQGNTHYGIFIESCGMCTFQAIVVNGYHDKAAIAFHPDLPPARTVFMSVVAENLAPGGAVWLMPANQSGITFIQCNQP